MSYLNPKDEFKALVAHIKKVVRKADGSAMRNEDIAARLHYDRTHLSKLLGERGVVTERHVTALKNEFASELGTLAQEPAASYGRTRGDDVTREEYDLLLETVNRTESKLDSIIKYLETIEKNQVVMAAMSDAGQEELLRDLAKKRGLEAPTFLRSIRNKAISKLRTFEQSGIAIAADN